MSTVTKFNSFSENLARGVHNFGTDVFKLMLTNVAPNAANSGSAEITQIASGNGYAIGGPTVALTLNRSGAVTTVQGAQVTILAAGGNIPTFRYLVLYNDSASDATKNLIQFYDHGAPVNLGDGDSYVFSFANANPGNVHIIG